MAVKLGDDDAADAYGLFESLCLSEACLTNATVHDEDASVWLDALLHLNHFVKERLFLTMAT